jgi:eukaryotic-like serine/threonine-protein kinase
MDFLRSYLPGPVVDIFLPIIIVLALAYFLVPKLIAKVKETGAWDRAVDKVGGEKLRLMQFEREINRLQKSGDVLGAARLYEEAEWYPEAINLYVEAEEYISAGSLYEQLEQWERAADMYLKGEDWKRAAKLLAKVGKPAEAAKHYEQHGQKIDAAKFYFDAGQYDRAAQLYEDVSYFPQAAKCFEKLGQYIKAAENYEQQWLAATAVGGGGLIASPSDRESKVALYAGQLYEKGGSPERAADLYKRAGLSREAAVLAAKEGRFRDAAEMLLKEEKLPEAAAMFEKAGDVRRAALLHGEIAFHQGDGALAAEKFLAGGDNLRAAELFETVGNLEAAARCYEQSDAVIQAANVYLRAHDKLKAAALFERGGDFDQAALLFEEAGNQAKASALYEQSGRYYEAGKIAHSLGDSDRAIQLLQLVDGGHEQYDAATLILSQLFIDKNMPALAVDKLKRLIGEQQISAANIDHFYSLSRAYEKLGNNADAVSTLRKIMTERYGYKDVEQTIERLTAPNSHTHPAPVPPPPPPAPAAVAPAPIPATSAPREEPPAPEAPAPKPAPSGSPIQLGEELGKGLLGTTYRAIDRRNQQPVVVKLLRGDLLRDRLVVQQFLAEAQAARSLEHPSLVRFLGLVEIQGAKAAVTEYVEGFDLAAFLSRNKRISIKQSVDLLTTLADAFGYAHEKRLLHRDLKPSNILVGKAGKLKIAGFGLGALRIRELDPGDGYPSPEFLSGAPFGIRSDIYALGALIFHALTGQNPGAGRGVSATVSPPRLRQLLPEAPDSLDQILARCLMPDPAQRFGTTGELLAAAKTVQA